MSDPIRRPLLRVVAHEGYRNGATRVLLGVLPRVVDALGCDVRVEVRAEGPLAGPLRDLSTVTHPDARADVVWVNSALAAGALAGGRVHVPSLVYVHEVGEALARLPDEAVDGLVAATAVRCVSARAAADLAALGVDPDRIAVQPPPIEVSPPAPAAVAAARAELRAGPDDLLVVGCGEATWRKGADHFVALAQEVPAAVPARFAWIGRRSRGFARVLDHDTRNLRVPGRVRWHGEVDDAAAHLAAADVLVLTSREDPQPLVPLEAAVLGTPTVGLAGTGLDDLAALGGARTVPYPDLAALAAAVVEVGRDEPQARALVAAGRELAATRTVDAVAAHLVGALRSLLANEAGEPRR